MFNDSAGAVGFQRCVGVRYKNYKWLGRTNKVYRCGPAACSARLRRRALARARAAS